MKSPYLIQKLPDQKINMLIYGNNGVGKTTLAATAQFHPEMKDVLFVDVEGGLLSIADNPYLPEGIMAVTLERSEDLEELYWALARRHDHANSSYATVNTVVFDSGTELQTLGLEDTVAKAIEKTAGTKNKREDPDDVFQEDYGKNARFLARWLRAFRDLDVNMIITAYERYRFPPRPKSAPRDAELEPVECLPEFSPKIGQHLRGYMDFVWWMFTKGEEGNRQRFLLTQPKGIYYAKTRGTLSERIGEVVEWKGLDDPIMSRIYDAITNGGSEHG